MTERAAFDPQDCALRFAGSGARLFLDAADNRAAFLIRKRGVSQHALYDTWTGILAALRPEAILDIGANYGEMFLPRRIAPGCALHLYEANPRLLPFLERSCAAHPDAPSLRAFGVGVSDRAGLLRFHADLKWSGTSSFDFRSPDGAYKGAGEAAFLEVEVPTTTLDAAIAALPGPAGRIAVKVDTEGHEPRVLAAGGSLAGRRFALVMEAHPGHLARAGSTPGALLCQAAALGAMFRVAPDGRFAPLGPEARPGPCDILVTNDEAVLAHARERPAPEG